MEETYAIEIPKASEHDSRRIEELAVEHGITGVRTGIRAGGMKLEAATYDDAALLLELCSVERAQALAPFHTRLSVPVTLSNLPRRARRLDTAGRWAWVFTDGSAGVIATMRPGATAAEHVAIEQASTNVSGQALAKLFESDARREQLACACAIASDPFGAWLLGAAELSRRLLPELIRENDGDNAALMKAYWLLRHGVAGDLPDGYEGVFRRAQAFLGYEQRDAIAKLVPRRRSAETISKLR